MRRPERLAEVLKEEIAEIVGFELNDPRFVAVTVTDVVVSADLRDAKVFVLVEGSESEISFVLNALKSAALFVRRQVAMNLNLRHAPHIYFARDSAEENAARIGRILQEMEIRGELSKRTDLETGE